MTLPVSGRRSLDDRMLVVFRWGGLAQTVTARSSWIPARLLRAIPLGRVRPEIVGILSTGNLQTTYTFLTEQYGYFPLPTEAVDNFVRNRPGGAENGLYGVFMLD